MRILLDTHAVLWWWLDDPKLSLKARSLIEDSENEIFVSAASALEIAIKVRIGKLPEARRLMEDFGASLAQHGFSPLDITTAHACHAGLLDGRHGDPFDRILAAQSSLEGMAVVSNDKSVGLLGGQRVW